MTSFALTYESPAAWGRMWMLAFMIFYLLKGSMFVDARRWLGPTKLGRAAAFFLAWPGMDTAAFFVGPGVVQRHRLREWMIAAAKTMFGVALLWGVVPRVVGEWPLAAGWLGMTGIVFVLHFGLFHLAALAWHAVGVDVEPLMDRPIMSTSLSDFWSRRWNRAFRRAADRLVYRPTARRYDPVVALVASFLFSGLVHDLVISVPAGAGYGLPTAYFLIQAIGVLAAHSAFGKRWHLQRGATGRVFTAVVLIAPVGLLFHTPFLSNVVLPFLKAIGCY